MAGRTSGRELKPRPPEYEALVEASNSKQIKQMML
jgi:hypothetical protein